jgi:Short C-terminal domain
MLNSLTGWHFIVILGVIVIPAIVVIVGIVIAIRLSRKNVSRLAAASPDPVGQIQRLAQLRDEGLLSEAEYEAKRAELLDRI